MKPKKEHRSPDPHRADRKRNDALNKDSRESENSRTGKGKLPGEYPAKEDIMNRRNTSRVGMDVENFSRKVGPENFNKNEPTITDPNSVQEDPIPGQDIEDRRNNAGMEHPVSRSVDDNDLDIQDNADSSDVTEEDLEALGPKDLSMDMGEDEQLLKNRVWPVDMAGDDLDVPGSELDDRNEAIGSEDEENNPYSLGGDSHEDNMEGK